MKTVAVRVPARTYDSALAACNRIRAAFKRKPVTTIKNGVSGYADKCPIQRTLGKGFCVVDASTISFDDDDIDVNTTVKEADAIDAVIKAVDKSEGVGVNVRVVRGMK